LTGTKQYTTLSGWGNFPRVKTILKSAANTRDIDLNDSQIARGLGRSYADQAVNEGHITLETSELNRMLSFDEQSGILECEAGVSLDDIIKVFAPRGWFPMICPGTKFVTIGGAIANDIHGKAHHSDGSFVNSVQSFKILLASGEIANASREENTDLFWANFGGLGLLGIILSARIRLIKIETTYFKQQSIKISNLEHLLEALETYDAKYKYSVAWINPGASGDQLGKGVLTVGNPAQMSDLTAEHKSEPLKVHTDGKLSVPFYLPSFTLNPLTSKLVNTAINFSMTRPQELVHYDKFFFPLDAINNWNKGYGKRGFLQYQFVLPHDIDVPVLREILQNIVDSGCNPLLNVFKKMGPKQGLLSFPMEGYTLAIDFPISDKLLIFLAEIDQKVLEAGGRIYLGKDAVLDENTFKSMYPELEEWMKVKRKYDPENTFSSSISRRLGLQVN